MTVVQKVIIKFLNNPEAVKFRDVERILFYVGFEKISTKGSHFKYKHSSNSIKDIVIPIHNNECKGFYKKLILRQIKKLL